MSSRVLCSGSVAASAVVRACDDNPKTGRVAELGALLGTSCLYHPNTHIISIAEYFLFFIIHPVILSSVWRY